MKKIIYLILPVLLMPLSNLKADEREPLIRVLLLDNQTNISISVDQSGNLKIYNDKSQEIFDEKKVSISPSKDGISVNKREINSNTIRIRSTNENFLNINSGSFRGILDIIKKGEKLIVVNSLPLELYITGLINSEIASSWPKESIKAQAVAARTYALYQIELVGKKGESTDYDIRSTIMDQVYSGAHLEDIRSHNIVKLTAGEILKRNGKILPAFYHSCCGGRTESAHNVWEGSVDTTPVEDKFCMRSPRKDWFLKLSENEFRTELAKNNIKFNKINSIMTIPFIDSPRISSLLIETNDDIIEIKATKLRKILGYSNFKSTWFNVEKKGPNIVFEGHGYGHGVGMCQWGAKGMAEEGYSHREILEFYYPQSEIFKAY